MRMSCCSPGGYNPTRDVSESDDETLQGTEPSAVTQTSAPSPTRDSAVLERGSCLGRYVVLERLGAGGMGVVYAAYDPELDRKIALKLVRNPDARSGDTGPTRLQREAQAMAKLSHHNVIAVHDVGVVDGRVFIAMEFVDGQTLSSWLGQRRSWTAVLDVFTSAGAGLLAAHEAGIVHRDFKPDNVLLGHDGRVRVMDFGLARADDEHPGASSSEALPDADDSIGSTLTAAGTIMGTPAYMAPEQHQGLRADARSDQFSFCVALYEALYGKRPFAGDNLHALMLAVSNGEIEPAPKQSQVPAWLRAIVLRGLATDPSSRFSSMRELLAAIEAGRKQPSSRGLVLTTLVAGLFIALAVFGLDREATPEAGPCDDTVHQIDAAWDTARRDAVQATFAQAELPSAGVLASIDGYAQAWTQMRHDSCVATRVAGTQSDQLMDLRTACLERRRVELTALVDLLSSGSPAVLAEAGRLVENLVPVSVCADEERLRMRVPVPEDPAARAAVEHGERVLAEARSRLEAGLSAEALARLDTLEPDGLALAHAPLAAAVAELRGRILDDLDQSAEAAAVLAEAARAAARGGDDRLLVEVYIDAMLVVGVSLGRADEAAQLEQMAEVALIRTGRPPDLDRRWRSMQANLRRIAGKPDEALTLFQALRQELEDAGEGESILARDVDRRIGGLLANLGRYEEAEALMNRSIAAIEAQVGPDHPSLIVPLTNLATLHTQRGDFEQARAIHDRGIRLSERWLGESHTNTGVAYESLGILLHHDNQLAQARTHLERAEASYAKNYDDSHPSLVRVRGNLSAVLIDLGELEAAEQLLVRSRDALVKRFGDEHDYLVFINNNIAELYLRVGSFDEALVAIREARRIALERLGPDSERIGECHGIEAKIHAAAGDDAAAIASFELAREAMLRGQASPKLLIETEAMLAAALVRSRARRSEGEELFATALERARTTGEAGEAMMAVVLEQAKAVGVALP
jgi:tetratricopeptide (TPR) repeat protein/predicted Ser/Thr protein kinase